MKFKALDIVKYGERVGIVTDASGTNSSIAWLNGTNKPNSSAWHHIEDVEILGNFCEILPILVDEKRFSNGPGTYSLIRTKDDNKIED